MASTLLYLVRHGEHRHPPEGGDPADGGLTELGERQAALLGQRLADVPFDVVRHSPLARAAQTAKIVAGYLPGVPVSSCDLLSDRSPMPAPGQEDAVPEQYRAFLARTPEQERDPGAVHLNEAIEKLATAGPDARCELLVTHNFVIGWFVSSALGAPPWRWIELHQFTCALTILQVTAGEPPSLVSFNDVGHLPVALRGHAPIALRS